MIDANKLITGQEYYFHFQNCFCTGFFEKIVDGSIQVRSGHYFYSVVNDENKPSIFAYGEAFLDARHIVSIATT